MTLVLTLRMTEKDYKNGIERILRSIRDGSAIFDDPTSVHFNGHGRVDFTYDPDRRLYFAHDKDGAELLQGPARAARAFIDKMQAPTPDYGGDPGDLLVDVVYGGDDTAEETAAPKETPPEEKAAIIAGVMAAIEGQPGDPAKWGGVITDHDYWGGGGMTPNLF